MIDPRGPRFAAWITTFVLAAVLVTGSGWLLAAQAVVFALGAAGHNPYALFWKRFVKHSPPVELEDARPPRFAQVVGLAFGSSASSPSRSVRSPSASWPPVWRSPRRSSTRPSASAWAASST